MKTLRIMFTLLICGVWLINGLLCKVLNLVPRHEVIVSRILGSEHAAVLTRMIGAAEVLMVFWILSGFRSRECALFQIVIVAAMNILEFILVPDLLLFGRWNIVFAGAFALIVYINEFVKEFGNCHYSEQVMKSLLVAVVLSTAGLVSAAPAGDSHAAPAHQPSLEQRVSDPHPTVPASSPWPGAMVLLIIGMFGMALGVGMMVEINMPEEETPDTHSHDEPPGAITDDPHDAHLHGRH